MDDDITVIRQRIKKKEEVVRKLKMVKLHRSKVIIIKKKSVMNHKIKLNHHQLMSEDLLEKFLRIIDNEINKIIPHKLFCMCFHTLAVVLLICCGIFLLFWPARYQ